MDTEGPEGSIPTGSAEDGGPYNREEAGNCINCINEISNF